MSIKGIGWFLETEDATFRNESLTREPAVRLFTQLQHKKSKSVTGARTRGRECNTCQAFGVVIRERNCGSNISGKKARKKKLVHVCCAEGEQNTMISCCSEAFLKIAMIALILAKLEALAELLVA